jgi:hypothetical protein
MLLANIVGWLKEQGFTPCTHDMRTVAMYKKWLKEKKLVTFGNFKVELCFMKQLMRKLRHITKTTQNGKWIIIVHSVSEKVVHVLCLFKGSDVKSATVGYLIEDLDSFRKVLTVDLPNMEGSTRPTKLSIRRPTMAPLF